ncbi:hypothetical protein L873DRAFT_1824496 [Choiromyces venosus 120613-1]|uniref:Uncharacterized protein n=1 Tax=Choiromyces venosus 120613-1 TaxID=1336337 RepID=A0A3N4ISU3_9PEZI|nr:hypothetical protein L873DRAFT_1824496 [Choiromyces venosus 120613-1]
MCPPNRSIQGSVPEFKGCQVLLGRGGVSFFRGTSCILSLPYFFASFLFTLSLMQI